MAVYDSDLEAVKKLKFDEVLKCKVIKQRNYEFHKKYFALLNLVFQNQDRYTSLQNLRDVITIACGYYEEIITLDGFIQQKAKSISFDKMDELEFTDLYEKTIQIIVLHFDFLEEDIRENIVQYF